MVLGARRGASSSARAGAGGSPEAFLAQALAMCLQVTYRLKEADPLLRRALRIEEAAADTKAEDIAYSMDTLATRGADINHRVGQISTLLVLGRDGSCGPTLEASSSKRVVLKHVEATLKG